MGAEAATISAFGMHVCDVERSVEFYTRALGLTVRRKFSHQVVLAGEGDSATLILARRPGGETAMEPGAGVQKVVFMTRDANALYRRSIAAGGTSVEAPSVRADSPYRIGVVRDPDGYLVELIEPGTSAR